MDYNDASSSSFPVRHKKLSVHIKRNLQHLLVSHHRSSTTRNTVFFAYAHHLFDESKIDIIICSYDDQFMVMATQIGTMGTILHARKEEGMLNNPTFNVSVIFGKRDEPMLLSCARQLIEHISNSGSSKPLTLSLGLKDHSVETLKEIVAAVIENRLW